MAKAAIVLILLAARFVPLAAQRVSVDSLVLAQLAPFVHDSVEHVACLFGESLPDHILLTSALAPKQVPLGTHGVSADSSNCLAAVGLWHNHAVPHDSLAFAVNYLYFTLTDERTFLTTTNAAIAAVGVPGIWCFWTRLQVQAGYARNLTPLPNVPEQCFATP